MTENDLDDVPAIGKNMAHREHFIIYDTKTDHKSCMITRTLGSGTTLPCSLNIST